MSVKKKWCSKLHTINHVHQAYQNTFEAQWRESEIPVTQKFCRSTSCYLIKHNLVMAPKAILTYLPTTQAWRPLASAPPESGSFRPVSRFSPIPVCPGSFYPHLLIVLQKIKYGKYHCKYSYIGHLFEDAIHFFLECPLYQHDITSLFNYFNNIVPISIEYILFGCNEISEELNTLLFKSVQKFIRQTCRFNN